MLLSWFHGDDVVAEHTASYRFPETVPFIGWAVSHVTYPVMAAADDDPPRALRSLIAGLSVTAFFFVPYAPLMLVRGGDFLQLLFETFSADGRTLTPQVPGPPPMLFPVGAESTYLLGWLLAARRWQLENVAVLRGVLGPKGSR